MTEKERSSISVGALTLLDDESNAETSDSDDHFIMDGTNNAVRAKSMVQLQLSVRSTRIPIIMSTFRPCSRIFS